MRRAVDLGYPTVVIDGHSTDGTRSIAEASGATVVAQASSGKGGAIVEAGLVVSDGVIVFIDADQSHDPDDIPRLAAPILSGQADLVIGSRMLGGSDELFSGIREFTRLVGGHILTLMIAKRFRHPLTDSQNGFRAVRAEVLRSLDLQQASFTIETEMCIEALRRGFRVMEIRSHEYRRSAGLSNINPLKLAPLYIWVGIRGISRRRLAPTAVISADVLAQYRPRWGDEADRSAEPLL